MYRLILATAFLFALAITRVVPAADRFVSTAGGDAANDCLSSVSPCRTVARGLAEAASGDTVKVGAGTYHENVSVSTPITLTLSGGWAADFSTQDPVAMPSVLQAAIDLPVVTVVANGIAITFAADGLTVQGGRNAAGLFGTPCQENLGGGICADARAGGSLNVALSRVLLQRNQAAEEGGGLAVKARDGGTSLALTVTNSTVTRNAAAGGGGIGINSDQNATVSVTLDGVLLKKNRAPAPHEIATPVGGGLAVSAGGFLPVGQNAQVLVQNCVFDGNRVTRSDGFDGQGGGIFAVNTGCQMGSCPIKVVNSVFVRNHAQIAAGVEVGGCRASERNGNEEWRDVAGRHGSRGGCRG